MAVSLLERTLAERERRVLLVVMTTSGAPSANKLAPCMVKWVSGLEMERSVAAESRAGAVTKGS
jgi:hypothetical protein